MPAKSGLHFNGNAFQCHFSWTILLFPELWSQWYLSLTPPDFSFKIDWFVLGPEARGAKSWCPKKFGPFYQGDLVIVKSARDLDQVLTISACKLLHIFGQLYKGMPYHRTSLGIIKNHWKSSESIRHHWNPISKKNEIIGIIHTIDRLCLMTPPVRSQSDRTFGKFGGVTKFFCSTFFFVF